MITSAMPDNATRVTDWLKARKGRYFCQRCVSTGTGVKPVNQVNQIVRPLGKTKDYRYVNTTCSGCGADLKCVAYPGERSGRPTVAARRQL